MMCTIVPQTTMVEELQGWLIHIEVAARMAQPESHPPADSQPQDKWKPIPLCGSLPALVVPAEHYVEQLGALLDNTLEHSTCGIGSDTPVGKGGTLDLKTLTITGAIAPDKPLELAPGVPPPPEYLPEMKDEQVVKVSIKSLSPRIVAVHGPTGTGKSTVFPLAITHWTMRAKELQSGLTICAQPRRILAQQLCKRVKENRKMHYKDRTVGYVIAKESSSDSSTKLLYCTEAIVALMMQTYLVSSDQPALHELITTVVIDEVHNRSAHSDYVLALTLAAMQKKSTLRLVLMSATGDHSLVRERIPHCQQLVMKGVMRNVKRCFLEQPLNRSDNLLNQIAQIVITYHNERVGQPLIEETCHCKGVNESNKIMVFIPGLAQIYQFCEILQRALDLGWTEMLIPLPFHGQSSREDVDAVLSDPSLLASSGRYPLGQNRALFAPESFDEFSAPPAFQVVVGRAS